MINYDLLHRSTVYYAGEGYCRIEAPWTVTQQISDITRPKLAKDYVLQGRGKVLVASGEQSFLYLYLKNFLPKGKFQAITPCFRDESFDFTHTKYFMKNELINTNLVHGALDEMINSAKQFFGSFLGHDEIKVIETGNNNYDLTWRSYELGSYGIRRCDFLEWIYGTGLAEPRFSSLYNLKQDI